ncbi:MAG: hypothetical protein AAF519_12825 [Bacteroidota bacterium]
MFTRELDWTQTLCDNIGNLIADITEIARLGKKIVWKITTNKKAPKHLFRLFKRFDEKVEGTGLVLYIIRQIIQSHGGDTAANSEVPAIGAMLVISLPKKSDRSKTRNTRAALG